MIKSIAIIPARGGSKRIPKKNIKSFYGKPLIYYAIKSAIKSNCFERIIVSTDNKQIARISKKYGAEILFMRPKKLSNDKASTRAVTIHCIKFLQNLRVKFDYVCQIYPTAVLMNYKNLKKGLNLIKSKKYNFVFGVSEYPYPIQRSFKIVKKGGVKMKYPRFRYKSTNNLEKNYHDAGQFYIGHKNSFLNYKPMFGLKSFPIIIGKSDAWDIDDTEDWKIAKSLYKLKKR